MPRVTKVRKHTDDLTRNWTIARKRMMLRRFKSVPYPNWLGIKIAKLSAGAADLSLRIEGKHQQYLGTAHGGVLASLADTAATFAALTALPEGMDVVTIEFKVNFVAAISAGKLLAKGSTVRVGSRVAVSEVRVYGPTKDRLALTGTFTMLVFPKTGTT